ncbi:MAG: hypothetical protein ACMG6E_04240, partial [Candidatus Roizmanbacteria bacterium]
FYMILLHNEETTYLVTTEKSEELQYQQLKDTLTATKINGKKLKSVDVRFDKPVVVLDGE